MAKRGRQFCLGRGTLRTPGMEFTTGHETLMYHDLKHFWKGALAALALVFLTFHNPEYFFIGVVVIALGYVLP